MPFRRLIEDVDNGECYACVGKGVYGKSLYLFLNFAMDLKGLFKKFFLIKIINLFKSF